MRVAHLPFAFLAKVFGVITPFVTIEGDLKKRHGEDFCGLGIRAIEFAAEPHGHAVDEKGVEQNIADTDEKNGIESAPRKDSREGTCRWLGRFRSRCGVCFCRAAGFSALFFRRFF